MYHCIPQNHFSFFCVYNNLLFSFIYIVPHYFIFDFKSIKYAILSIFSCMCMRKHYLITMLVQQVAAKWWKIDCNHACMLIMFVFLQ